MSFHVMSCHVMSFHVVSRNVMSCHDMPCHCMAHHVTSCHVMSLHLAARRKTSSIFYGRDARRHVLCCFCCCLCCCLAASHSCRCFHRLSSRCPPGPPSPLTLPIFPLCTGEACPHGPGSVLCREGPSHIPLPFSLFEASVPVTSRVLSSKLPTGRGLDVPSIASPCLQAAYGQGTG